MTNEQLQHMQQLLQKSLIKIKTLEAALEHRPKEPVKEAVAIVGCGVRLPENIHTTEDLWQLLKDKKSAVRKIPADRFDVDAIYHPDGSTVGKTNARYGTFLSNDVRSFDAPFFSISPREAKCLDPLQRMVLEVVYEAFEQAAIPSESLRGSKTGVYIALGNSDYISARFRSGNLDTVDVYDTTGILFGTAGGRVSFSYDFCGPSFNVDAACASTLLAMHLAKEDLQKNHIDLAVVSSANLLLTPEMFVGLSKLGSLSSEACRAFADDCDGYIRGEGCGVLLLKRLSDAQQHNDNIELIIRGSSVKHNGTTNGFTAPNPNVISSNIEEAIKEAGITADDVDFVEAHGIGNRFTDAVEVQSIHEGYKDRTKPVYVGSVKANIGHLEAGTGMPMVFKVIEAMKNRCIPAQININALNQDVDWSAIRSVVNREHVDWQPVAGRPLYAAINLSGYSGTNAHMIFESPAAKKASDQIAGPYHFVLSAKDGIALKNTAQKYLNDTALFEKYTLAEICYTLQFGRNHFPYAVSVTGHTAAEIIAGLSDFVQDIPAAHVHVSAPEKSESTHLAFLFTGQGAQYYGMCKAYYDTFGEVRHTIDECDALLQPYLQLSIKEIMWGTTLDKNLVHLTKYTQPALFVAEYAIAMWWQRLGIQPDALIGHSIGELVALTVAKALTLKDALQLVVARAALMNALPLQEGSMASVFCSEETLRPFLATSNVDLAAVNSVKNCTVSGKKEEVQSLLEVLREQHIKAVPLQVSHAFHSAMMEPVLDKFISFAKQIQVREPEIPVVSNVTGMPLTKAELTPEYFARHIRQTVLFHQGMTYLDEAMNTGIYLEIGPNPVLISLAKQSITHPHVAWLHSVKKDTDDIAVFHTALQQLYVAGKQPKWDVFYKGKHVNRVSLPTYGWNKKVYWENPVFQQRNQPQSISAGKQTKTAEPVVRSNAQATQATRETLLAYMQIEAAKVLGLEAGQKVDIHKTYREQGFDSMMSGEFLSLMEKHIGAELKMEVIHQYNTPKELHQYLIDTYFGGGEIDTTQAITMADIMFNQEMENQFQGDWHEIRPEDGMLMRWFKKFDKYVPSVKDGV